MTDQELEARYEALTDQERKDFHVKLNEYVATLLNPNQGPYDNAHWHKVPPSPIIAPPVEVTAANPTVTQSPAVGNPAPAVAKRSLWGWNKH